MQGSILSPFCFTRIFNILEEQIVTNFNNWLFKEPLTKRYRIDTLIVKTLKRIKDMILLDIIVNYDVLDVTAEIFEQQALENYGIFLILGFHCDGNAVILVNNNLNDNMAA